MNVELMGRVREVFEAVSALPPAERERALAGVEASVRAEVQSLLASHDEAGEFLSKPAAALIGADGADPLIGFTLAGYRMTGLLGTGGMGAVYSAEQMQPRRTVALKVIRAGWVTAALRRRFAHEAEALGRLRHPGIAQIFEAGSAPGPDGRETPFFAMELVRGVSLTEHGRGRTLKEKLMLFAMVCDAAHHAHQKGIVHRDLKPGNILVEEDGETHQTKASTSSLRLSSSGSVLPGVQPKILDFGIARLTDSDAAITTMQTDPGQLVGTLAYMSPEQVRGDVERIDTRSDVYALGVVLFELLTGRLPYSLKGKAVPEAARVIADDEPTMPGSMDRQLRGDLETIILKAIAKEPERRYQSAAELGADVRRHLSDLPIVARPATTVYQLRKFARRNRALVGGVCAAFVLLVLGVLGTTWELVRAMDAERLAKSREQLAAAEARKARKSVDFLVTMLTSADPDKTAGKEVTVREMLDQAAGGVRESLRDDSDVRFAAEDAIGRTYRAVGAPEKAGAHLGEALTLAGTLFGEQSPEYASVLHEIAETHVDRHEWSKVIQTGGRAMEILESQPKPDGPHLSRLCALLGSAYVSLNDIPTGEKMGRRAYDLAVAAGSKEDIAAACGLLSDILQRVGGKTAAAESEQFVRQQVETLTAIHGPVYSATLKAKESLGWYLANERRTKEAIPFLEQAEEGYRTLYGPQHRLRLNALTLLARCYQDLAQLPRGEELASEAVAGLKVAAPDSPDLAFALMRLGRLKYLRKDYAGAEVDYREALRIYQLNGDPRASGSMSMLAGALEFQNKLEDALAIQNQALELRRASGNPGSDFGTMLNNNAVTLGKAGRIADAERVFQESVAYDRKVRPGHPLNGLNLRTFAVFLNAQNRPAEAETLAREAWELAKGQSAPERRGIGAALLASLEAQGKADQAAALKTELDALAPPSPPAPPSPVPQPPPPAPK